MPLSKIKKELRGYASEEKAKVLRRFFKTGPGEYGEGDIFIGVQIPEIRRTAKKNKEAGIRDIEKLIKSPVHEDRLLALLILIEQKKGNEERNYGFYLDNMKYINNWDLVDLSAPRIVGEYLYGRKRELLYTLARSGVLWERRIAVISTFPFIKRQDFKDTLGLSGMLLTDSEDLIHKAVGWMLREVGKRSLPEEEGFLEKEYKKMPRTMLRYAIERFPEKKRQAYLRGKI